jgi:hypothetical protein
VPVRGFQDLAATDYFAALGSTIERAWARHNCNEDDFPSVAEKALRELEVPPDLDAAAILRSVVIAPHLPNQEDRDGLFGQPPLTVYRGRGFYIAALFWFDGTTTIHEHGFSGAFRVLEGSSIHVGYRFDPTEVVNHRLRFGTLAMTFAEVLERGDVRPILASSAGAHSLFHLARPSVTIVVRTYLEPWAHPQLDYLRPGLAYDPRYRSGDLDLRLRAITALREMDSAAAVELAKDFLTDNDLLAGVTLVQRWSQGGDRGERLDDLLDHLARTHGSIGGDLRAVFEQQRHDLELVLRRRMLHEPRHRLFLAVLMNLHDDASRVSVLQSLFSNRDPLAVVAEILLELSSPELRGVSGLNLTPAAQHELQAALQAGDCTRVLDQVRSTMQEHRASELLTRLFA